MEELNNQRTQIVAKTFRGVELIPVENIYYFLADQKYVTVRHKNGSVLIDETLKDLEQEFGEEFIRIHRNALVSVNFLSGLELVSSGQYQVKCHGLEEKIIRKSSTFTTSKRASTKNIIGLNINFDTSKSSIYLHF